VKGQQSLEGTVNHPWLRAAMRRPKAFRWALWNVALFVIALAAFACVPRVGVGLSVWALAVGVISSGFALVAGACALVYRITETPHERATIDSSPPRNRWRGP
jgi:predicted anti-sigma-YlaC factor YlaD